MLLQPGQAVGPPPIQLEPGSPWFIMDTMDLEI